MGSGWKDWEIGEIVEAGEFQSFVQDQVVQYYETTAERGSAVAVPQPGMVSYLQDSKSIELYNGAAWVGLESTLNDGTAGFTALSNGTAGISYQPVSHNYVINGAFDVWQRGTTISGSIAGYFADRWRTFSSLQDPAQVTDAPEGFAYAAKLRRNSGSAAPAEQRIESKDAVSLVGKTVVLSVYAKEVVANGRTLSLSIWYPDATDDWATQTAIVNSIVGTLSTSWQRFEITATIPAEGIRGLKVVVAPNGASQDFYITGVQLEAGSIATPFKRHAPSLQGELAACQRYCQVLDLNADGFDPVGNGHVFSTTQALVAFPTKVMPRKFSPNFVTFGTVGAYALRSATNSLITCTNMELDSYGFYTLLFKATVASGLTAGNATTLNRNSTTTGGKITMDWEL
jgi:hypothetical protein